MNTEERRPGDDRGRDGSDGTVRQGMPRIAGNNRKLGERAQGPANTLIQVFSIVLSDPVCGTLLHSPEK